MIMIAKVLLLLAFVACSYAITINVPVGSDITAIIGNATEGDTIVLSDGIHYINSSIVFDKGVIFKGSSAAILSPAPDIDKVMTLVTSNLKVKIDGITIQGRNNGSYCNLASPYALMGNYTVDLVNPNIVDGVINVEADLGHWFTNRYVYDVYFGNCSNLLHGLGTTNVSIPMYEFVVYDNCKASAFFSVIFTEMAFCGVTPDKVSYPTWQQYIADITVEMKEWVIKVTNTTSLRKGVDRTGTGISRLSVLIKNTGDVVATIAITYASTDFQAQITRLGIKEADAVNTSIIEITMTLPSPYTVISNSSGPLVMTNMNDNSAVASLWTSSLACDMVPSLQYCNITINMTVKACDLTGQYKIKSIPVRCQNSSLHDDTCPSLLPLSANITFFIRTNNFCRVELLNMTTMLNMSVILRPNDTYIEQRPTNVFTLGEMSYWSIRIQPNNSLGIGIKSAVVTKFVRTSDGNCNPYTAPYINIMGLNQTYNNLTSPVEINNNIPITAAVACASSITNTNAVVFYWTVLVDYVDSSRRRRRRDVQAAQKSGELEATSDIGVIYADEDLTATDGQEVGSAGSSMSKKSVIIIVGTALSTVLFFLCCCCACGGLILYRRNQKKKEKEIYITTNPPSSTSQMQMFSVPIGSQSNYNLHKTQL